MIPFLVCETKSGLRDTEVTVTVRDVNGRPQRLRVEEDFLYVEDDRKYLPVGIVGQHPETKNYLIELPHEADSGANRLWVDRSQLLLKKEAAVR